MLRQRLGFGRGGLVAALMVAAALANDGFNLHSPVLSRATGYLALIASVLVVIVLAYPVVHAAISLISLIAGLIASSGKHQVMATDPAASLSVRAALSPYASARYLEFN